MSASGVGAGAAGMGPRPGPLLRRTVAVDSGAEVVIRPSRSEDAEALVALHDAVAAEGRWIAAVPGQRSALEERLGLASILGGGGLAIVATRADEVVGQLSVVRPRIPFQAHLGEVAVAVAAAHRGQGVGSALLGVAADWARAVGVAKLWLAVFTDNDRAIRAYERTGFVAEGRQRDQVRVAGRSRDLLLMGLRISPPVR